ncbi:MAG: TMEM198/TM7SF3 family protein, partial [Erysipelotrichia bacterium]|nr:TMEM198/TM7SF3 family protein [Erysipelotrichia bacterium]
MIAAIENIIRQWIDTIQQKLPLVGIGGFAFSILWNLFICFFGYRFYRACMTILGFLFGTALSYGLLSAYTQLQDPIRLILSLAGGAVIAAAAYLLYRISVFILVLLCLFFVSMTLLGQTGINSTTVMIISLAVGIVFAILSVKYMKPILIVATALAGGQGTVKTLCDIIGMNNSIAMI